uniref:Uncharacterized protein n=1 Tax=Opuntia streptacantha TaxID=393608 RepID=A0A7C8ZCV2_OPUST
MSMFFFLNGHSILSSRFVYLVPLLVNVAGIEPFMTRLIALHYHCIRPNATLELVRLHPSDPTSGIWKGRLLTPPLPSQALPDQAFPMGCGAPCRDHQEDFGLCSSWRLSCGICLLQISFSVHNHS